MIVRVIPDQHQRTEEFDKLLDKWPENVDFVVFLGDLVDDWNSKEWWNDVKHNPINCIKKVSSLKDKYKEKFIWILGNHDLTYIPATNASEERDQFNVSGHQTIHHIEISEAFVGVSGKWQIAKKIDGVVYTHAGITKDWLKSNSVKTVSQVNKLASKVHYYFDHCSLSPTGDDTTEGPLWVRPTSLLIDSAFPKQVVGHTEVQNITLLKSSEAQILLLDSPEHNNVVDIIDGNLEVPGLEVQELSDQQIECIKLERMLREQKRAQFLKNI